MMKALEDVVYPEVPDSLPLHAKKGKTSDIRKDNPFFTSFAIFVRWWSINNCLVGKEWKRFWGYKFITPK